MCSDCKKLRRPDTGITSTRRRESTQAYLPPRRVHFQHWHQNSMRIVKNCESTGSSIEPAFIQFSRFARDSQFFTIRIESDANVGSELSVDKYACVESLLRVLVIPVFCRRTFAIGHIVPGAKPRHRLLRYPYPCDRVVFTYAGDFAWLACRWPGKAPDFTLGK